MPGDRYVNAATDTALASISLTTSHGYNATGLLVKTEVISPTQTEKLSHFSYDGRNRHDCVAVRMNPMLKKQATHFLG